MPISRRYYGGGSSVSSLNRTIRSAQRQNESNLDAEMAFNYRFDLVSPQAYLAHVEKRIKEKREAGDVDSYYNWETKKIEVNRKILSEERSSFRYKQMYEIAAMGHDNIGKSYKKMSMLENLYNDILNDPYMDAQSKQNQLLSIMAQYENAQTALENIFEREARKGAAAELKAVNTLFKKAINEVDIEIDNTKNSEIDEISKTATLADLTIRKALINSVWDAELTARDRGDDDLSRSEKIKKLIHQAEKLAEPISGSFDYQNGKFLVNYDKVDSQGHPVINLSPEYERYWDGEKYKFKKGNDIYDFSTDDAGDTTLVKEKEVRGAIQTYDPSLRENVYSQKRKRLVDKDGNVIDYRDGNFLARGLFGKKEYKKLTEGEMKKYGLMWEEYTNVGGVEKRMNPVTGIADLTSNLAESKKQAEIEKQGNLATILLKKGIQPTFDEQGSMTNPEIRQLKIDPLTGGYKPITAIAPFKPTNSTVKDPMGRDVPFINTTEEQRGIQGLNAVTGFDEVLSGEIPKIKEENITIESPLNKFFEAGKKVGKEIISPKNISQASPLSLTKTFGTGLSVISGAMGGLFKKREEIRQEQIRKAQEAKIAADRARQAEIQRTLQPIYHAPIRQVFRGTMAPFRPNPQALLEAELKSVFNRGLHRQQWYTERTLIPQLQRKYRGLDVIGTTYRIRKPYEGPSGGAKQIAGFLGWP